VFRGKKLKSKTLTTEYTEHTDKRTSWWLHFFIKTTSFSIMWQHSIKPKC